MSAPPQSGKSGSSAPPRWKRARRRSPPSRSWWSGLTRWRWRSCALCRKAAVARANEMLAAAAAPDLPSASGKVGEILGKVVAGVSAIAQGTAMLSLSEETRPMRGGFILKDQNVEVNCTFETLVRLQRAETAGAVAKKLFG